MTKNIQVDSERLWLSLMQMAKIGATENGGCNRQALTDLDREGRQLFIDWCLEANCEIRKDKMGNIFARRAGANNKLPPVLTGSHLDTQPTGGKFDGVYGVLAGLEVIRSFNEQNIQTRHPLEVVVWTNEEGARFSPAMIGSGVWCGEFKLDYGWGREDKSGITLKDALRSTQQMGEQECAAFPVKAAFELHIEQGPILENENKEIGIVEGVQGMRWYDVTLAGKSAHAGPTPMEQRQDPVRGCMAICQRLYQLAEKFSPWARVTFGDINCEPGVRNTVPEFVTLAVDLRHPEQTTLDEMDKAFRTIVTEVATENNLGAVIKEEWYSPPVAFDSSCISAVNAAVNGLGYSNKAMFSGAGHDSVYVSRVAPTSMIFIPCRDGISHNEVEYAEPEHIHKGANVLANAMFLAAR